jgi:3-hydroxypropanoate dehydrogenase
MPELDSASLDQLFFQARTHSAWLDRPVSEETIRRLYDVARLGPTSANSSPMRIVFVRSPAAKERLKPALSPGNVEKTMTAPVTAIVAYDPNFYEQMGRLFPVRDMKSVFAAMPAERRDRAASLSATLEGGYLILAARALGLDCGPMGGFDNAKVDEEFLRAMSWRSLFLLNIGYADASKVHPRLPRLEFEEAARIE